MVADEEEGLAMNQDELFALIKKELDDVRKLSIFYDKPGLKTAWHVVDNLEIALKMGLLEERDAK